MQMRPSRVLKKLRNGEVASCTKANLMDPRAIEIAAMSGFDCIWLDMEHVPNTLHDVENQIRTAKIYDVDALVRVPRGSYSDMLYPLEMDAAGIMVPHLMSLDDAREVVWRTRFHPVGRRPIDGGNADGKYCTIPINEYVKQANEERFVIVQIEDPEPLDELEEICQVDGIDMIFFGPGDFSQGLGVLGHMDDPRIVETRKRIAEVATRNGKVAATICGPDQLNETIDLGYRFVSVGADVIALVEYFRKMYSYFKPDQSTGAVDSVYGGKTD